MLQEISMSAEVQHSTQIFAYIRVIFWKITGYLFSLVSNWSKMGKGIGQKFKTLVSRIAKFNVGPLLI